MYLLEALTILVEEWNQMLENDKTRMSLNEVVQTLGGEAWRGIMPHLTPRQVANLIYDDLEAVDTLDAATEAIGQYQSEEQLLEERNLLGMMQDFGI
ncbi:MAG: hypothetical protein BA869_01430 [Desulfuromonadales bacterium C00003107]|jgi:hypothetical protein|nr:MAG: hypothetical protein BA869_01430 [Desulfuromonadales bacterium C00003107]